MHRWKCPLLFAILVVSFDGLHECAATLPAPHGINFIGIGYDIIKGNPEGGDSSQGGVDPGLKVTRNVLKLSYDNGQTSSDGVYRIPDETSFVPRRSTNSDTTYTSFYGTSSYREKLSTSVSTTGSYRGLFVSFAFAASSRYEAIASRTTSRGSVFFATKTVQNLGRARYRTDLASNDRYHLNREFVASACDLPSTYNRDTYMQFIEGWGTHVVTEVDVGTRTGENYEESRSSFVNFASQNIANSVSASGSYGPASASLTVNMETFNSQLNAETHFGSIYSSYSIGSMTMSEPISVTLMTMNEAFDDDFWSRRSEYEADGLCSSSWNIGSAKANILTALRGYAEWLQVRASSDPIVRIPLTWPDGTYGLTKTNTGCPNSQFTWAEGYRYHDTEDHNSNNYWSNILHLSGTWGRNNMQYKFCIKTHSQAVNSAHWQWSRGTYCIYKYGGCPAGFSIGALHWDDEDNDNQNSLGGVVPEGEYDHNTLIKFCCRQDGAVNQPIYLPTDNNFYLFPLFNQCQQVNGMIVTDEYFRWDNENDGNADSSNGLVPYEGVQGGRANIVLHFCYYQRA